MNNSIYFHKGKELTLGTVITHILNNKKMVFIEGDGEREFSPKYDANAIVLKTIKCRYFNEVTGLYEIGNFYITEFYFKEDEQEDKKEGSSTTSKKS